MSAAVMTASVAVLICGCLPTVTADHPPLQMTWVAKAPLPFPRSDMTATTVIVNGTSNVFVIGGCTKDQGWVDDYGGFYACPEITDKCTVYDPVTNTHKVCPAAPRQRYRHAAAAVNGSIWLVGGRAVDDSIVQEVDVYNPTTQTWSTPFVWAGATSDLAAFENDGDLYFIGGYEGSDYTASDKMWKLATNSQQLTLVAAPSLQSGRGDISAAHTDKDTVYVSGGFTHEDGFCKPHASVEKFDIATQSWSAVSSLSGGRGDKSLIGLKGNLFAIGGETKDNCTTTVAVDVVEVYDPAHDTWAVETKIQSPTFRFVGAAADEFDALYIFGGQSYLNKTCNCYNVKSEVWGYVHNRIIAENEGAYSPASVVSPGVVVMAFCLLMAFGV